MRLKTYINEATVKLPNGETAINTIKDNCKTILKIYQKNSNILWRRDKSGGKSKYKIKTVRSDRRPQDTPKWMNEFLDEWFTKNFGWKARTESLFCWLDPRPLATTALTHQYIVFPYDPFKYIYSPQVVDFYTDVFVPAREQGYERGRPDIERITDLTKFTLAQAHYTDKNAFSTSLNRSVEIMIKTKRAVYISPYIINEIADELDLKAFSI